MADLQLAPRLPVGVMFPHNKTEAPGLHSAKQDPYEQGDSPQRSSMGHLRNTFPQKLLNSQELELENVHIHPKGNPCTKVRRSSYPCSSGVIHRPDSGSNLQVQEKGSFYPSSPQPQYLKASDQDFIPFPKKRVGVDRAYPLKPMFHRKSGNAGEVGTDGEQNVCLRLPGPRSCVDSDFDFRSWMNASLVATMQAEKAMAELHKTERAQIQRLEAAGESLQKEIRRKEMLLREKLKRTEEGLRRIQKEKEQAKEKNDRELQNTILPKRRVKDSNAKYKPVFSPEFMSEDVFGRDRREDETCELENPSPFQLPHYGIQRLKRERLGASNKNTRDQRGEPSADKFSQSSEELDSAWQGLPRSSSLPGTPGSSESSCSTKEHELGKCNHCGRSFLLPRLERHSAVCGRMQGSKRKVFDSSRARAKGTELEQYLNWKGSATAKAEPRKSTWRQKHESFIRTLRHAREVQQIVAKGGNPSDLPPILPAANPDYVQCPHCSRHFAPKVAERHIPKCKTIKNRPPPPRKHES